MRSGLLQNKSPYLDSGFGEVDPAGQVLPDEGVGVVCPLKDPLQGLQLAAVEGGPVPALLPLLLLLRVHLLICNKQTNKHQDQRNKFATNKHQNQRTKTQKRSILHPKLEK